MSASLKEMNEYVKYVSSRVTNKPVRENETFVDEDGSRWIVKTLRYTDYKKSPERHTGIVWLEDIVGNKSYYKSFVLTAQDVLGL